MKYTGIMHVHSTYSYDGKNTVEEIAQFYKSKGYSFIFMTEHSDTFNLRLMSRFVQECDRLSNKNFFVIPGIEYTCENNLHLMGLGIRKYQDLVNPIEVAQHIRIENGLSVISHPSRYNYILPNGLEGEIDGVEIWNAIYDGRFIPNHSSISLLQSLRSDYPNLLAFGGQDLHSIKPYPHVRLRISCDKLSEESLLLALRHGKYEIFNSYFCIDAIASENRIKNTYIAMAQISYQKLKFLRDNINKKN